MLLLIKLIGEDAFETFFNIAYKNLKQFKESSLCKLVNYLQTN